MTELLTIQFIKDFMILYPEKHPIVYLYPNLKDKFTIPQFLLMRKTIPQKLGFEGVFILG